MGTREIIRLPSDDVVAEAVAGRWLKELARHTLDNVPYHVALPGGRAAKKLFAALLEDVPVFGRGFHHVEFFWGDERSVPWESDDSNFKLAKDNLLDPLQVPATRCHPIRGDLPHDKAAILAETPVRDRVPMNPNQVPVFDLILLGMGEDGHIASLFPENMDKPEPPGRIFIPVTGPKLPPERVTMTFSAISAARQVWVMATGVAKAEALKESILANGKTPLARLIRLRQHTHIFTDLPV